MLAVPGLFEVATRLFGLGGLTFTKLSAWLPVVALTLTTGSRQSAAPTADRGVSVDGLWGLCICVYRRGHRYPWSPPAPGRVKTMLQTGGTRKRRQAGG